MEKVKFLLGATKDKELAFADLEIKSSDYLIGREEPKFYFTVSFDVVKPFSTESIDEDYVSVYLNFMDYEALYNLCTDYACAPQDLASNYLEDHDISDIVDCSLYPAKIGVKGVDFMFEDQECGQVDLIDQMEEYTDIMIFSTIYMLWKRSHLKPLSKEEISFITDQISKLKRFCNENAIDEVDWIGNFIERNYR